MKKSVALLAMCLPLLAGLNATAQTVDGTQAERSSLPLVSNSISIPDGYVIGLDDVVGVLFWREEGMDGDVRVRPDGRISLPLIGEMAVVGLTPTELRGRITQAAKQFIADPNVTVVVREINSRKVFITGMVARPNSYSLAAPTTVLQLIAIAGGLTDYANPADITIVRPGVAKPFSFHYNDVRKGKNLQQNIELKVGDTVIVGG
jgi:polysaccharide biosynthesis/export protein